MGIFSLATLIMGNKCQLSPVYPLNFSFNVIIVCGILCQLVSSQKHNITFNGSSCTSSPCNIPQYSMITNTSRSSISFLCSSEFILNQYSSKSSSTACIAYPNKPKSFLLILPISFLLPLMNLSNHVPQVGVVVTTIFISQISKLADPSCRNPSLQIFPYADE